MPRAPFRPTGLRVAKRSAVPFRHPDPPSWRPTLREAAKKEEADEPTKASSIGLYKAKKEEADEPEKASSSGLPPLQRRRVEEELAGGETPEVHDRTREKTEGMKHKSQASKTAARARYRLNKWNRDNAVKDETLDCEEEQIAEWRKENPGEEEE